MHRSAWCRGIPLVLSVVLSWTPTAAQDVTGSLQGRFVGAGGGAEPEVRAPVSGPHLQGALEANSDRNGFFQFPAVPPGRYTLMASRVGLRPLEVRDLVVELGRTTGLGDLVVEAKPVELAPVVVTPPPLALDPVRTTAGGTLHASDYTALPVERDYKSLMGVLPMVSDSRRGDALNAAGSTGAENQYYIDGVNVTETRFANRATSLPYDFVRAVDVKLGGYEAQYGRALGAIVNAVTYSGTNDLEASVFGFAQPGGLVGEPRVAPVVGESGSLGYDYGARVSGPVVRDRLWFSTAVNPRIERVDRQVGNFGTYTDEVSSVRFANKLTWRADAGTRFELSVFGDPTVQDAVVAPPAYASTLLQPDAVLYRKEWGGVTASLRGSYAPSPALMLQATVAHQRDRSYNDGATGKGRTEPAYYGYYEGSYGGGAAVVMDDRHRRTSVALRGTLTRERHTVAAGLDYEDAEVSTNLDARGFIAHLDSAYYETIEDSYSGTFHNRAPALFVQDSWRVTDGFTLNAGLRWSAQHLAGASGRTAVRIDDEWQPRVGFVWDPDRRGRQRVFGSYGRFYQTIPTSIAAFWFVDYYSTWSSWSSDPRLPGSVPDQVVDASSFEKDWAKQIPGLKAEHFDEFTFGYERMLGPAHRLTLRGIRRDLRSSFQYGFDFSTFAYVLGTPGEGSFSFLPPPKREYTGLEIGAEGSWRALHYRGSYVWSRNWGNYPGLYNSDIGGPGAGFTSGFWASNQAVNSTGYLPNDRTHVFKLSAAYETRVGVSLGSLLAIESGGPVNDLAMGPIFGAYAPAYVRPRGSAGRTPALWKLDLRLAYEVAAVRSVRTRFQLDVLNVGSPRRATWVNEMHYLGLDNDGNPINPDPSYGGPVAYQSPVAARLGVQLWF